MRHPLFARVFDRVVGPAMEHEISPLREELLAGLHGRVLEVGAGNGLNFAHYPPSVSEVVALEPEPYLRARAELAANAAPVDVSMRDGLAETIPTEAASFDAAVASIVLCSVADPALALSELRRVLAPGGRAALLRARALGPATQGEDPAAARSGGRLAADRGRLPLRP